MSMGRRHENYSMLKQPYSYAEVEAIIDGYQWMCEQRTRGLYQSRLMDVERGFLFLPVEEKEALLLHGVCDLSILDVEDRTGVYAKTSWSRYRAGVSRITYNINRGDLWLR